MKHFLLLSLLVFFSSKPALISSIDGNEVIPSSTKSNSSFLDDIPSKANIANLVQEGRRAIIEARYVDAMERFTDLLDISKLLNDNTLKGVSLNYISFIHRIVGNHTEGLYYAQKAFPHLNNSVKVEHRLWALVSLGCAYFSNDQTDTAFTILQNAINMSKMIESDNQFMIYAYSDLASLMIKKNYLDDALKLLEESVKNPNTYHQRALAMNYFSIGRIHLVKGDVKKAHNYFSKAHNIARSDSDKTILAQIYTQKAKFFKEHKDYKRASDYYYLVDSLWATVIDAKIGHEVQRITLNYQHRQSVKDMELQKQLATNENLRLEQRVNRFLIFIFLLLLVISCLMLLIIIIKKRRAQEMAFHQMQIAKEKELQLQNYIKGQDEERSRLARDLHDGLGCQLALLKMNISKCIDGSNGNSYQFQNVVLENCDEVYKSLREIAFNLMPKTLIKMGLVIALDELSLKLTKSTGIYFSVRRHGHYSRLPISYESALFRIVQEISTNIIKYSHATSVEIELSSNENGIGITVCSNGQGFDLTELERSDGYGWRNINTRLQLIGGTIEVDSSSLQCNTAFLIDVPFNQNKEYGQAG